MNKNYFINKQDNIIIYGASYIGKEIFDRLCKQDRKVGLFLDKSADNIKQVCGVSVMHPETESLQIDAEHDVVIIAITDEYEHIGIANFLYEMGYRKLIFRCDAYEMISNAYDDIMQGRDVSSISIPYFTKMEYDMGKMERMFVDKKEDTYIVDIPSELLFYKGDDGELYSIYQNKPLMTFYNFLEGKENISYLEKCYNDNSTSLSRWMECETVQYRHLSGKWQRNELYKDGHIPFAKRLERGCYCIDNCMREVVFQAVKGYKLIRCEISKADFEFWMQPDIIKECIKNIEKYQTSFVYTPILHPFFYDFPCKRESYGHTRLMKICQYFLKNNITVRGKRVLDAGTYIGYFAQHMFRMGADVTAVEFDISNYDLANNLNKLLYCNGINLLNMGIQDITSDNPFNFAILLSVLNWHIDTEVGKQIIEKIDMLTTEALIWESGDEIEREKQWILNNSSFNHYEKISDTFGTGKIREMGVFRRRK